MSFCGPKCPGPRRLGKIATAASLTRDESGVHIDGSTIGPYRSDSPYKSIITNSGWKILEGNTVLIDCSKTKLTAPRVVISDMLVTGNAAWKPGSDKHLRLLSYGRR